MKLLHLDIETAPHVAYIWGPKNSYISPDHVMQSGYTLCWAAKWHDDRGVMFRSVQDADMVTRIHSLLNEADVVTHYNGSKFDIPTLNADFIEHGLPPPDPYKEVDLLKVSRQRFRRYSHKLDEVAKWLGLGTKVQHKGMELWTDCMAGDARAWRVMERYNKRDVRLLESVYNAFMPWIRNHPNRALYVQADNPTCTNCGSENVVKKGFEYTKTQRYQRYRCKDCETPLRGRFTNVSPDQRENILVQA